MNTGVVDNLGFTPLLRGSQLHQQQYDL